MNTIIPILIAGVILVVVVLVIMLVMRKKNTKTLREKFGPEYDLAMDKTGNRRTAEDSLNGREKRLNKLNIRELNQEERDRYNGEWTQNQSAFVEDPPKSVLEANRLITEVMIGRGFPVDDFDQRAADISVMFPNFVSNYREANAAVLTNPPGETSTEALRQAMLKYKSLFTELIGSMNLKKLDVIPDQAAF